MYESTVIVPWKLRQEDANSPIYGGDEWMHQCGRKVAFFTEQRAIEEHKKLRSSSHFRNRSGKKFTHYLCPWCQWYHLGNLRTANKINRMASDPEHWRDSWPH